MQIGFWLWAMSGFKRLPTQDEVLAYDPRWISDMRLAHQLYDHQTNQTAVMQLFDQYMAFQENPDAFRAQQELSKQAKAFDAAKKAAARSTVQKAG